MLTTTAISYTNGKPHIGHLYELVLADFLARKNKTPLLTGTDEHGKKIEVVAHAHGETPYDFCSRHAALFQSLADRAQVAYARFIRTTDADHRAFVQDCIRRAAAKGDIYLSTYEGWYCVREEAFVSEADAAVTGFKDPVSGVAYDKITEPAYYFRLSKYQDAIMESLRRIDIQPPTVLSMLEERLHSLKDICISRTTIRWGIPFPEPFEEGHVVYVWFDALLNYITGARSIGAHALHHVIGKDIVWFHTAIYLGILHACDLLADFTPTALTVHGFVTDEAGRKMSKSLGNVVDVEEILGAYPIEAVRFYMLYHTTLTGDFAFSREELVRCYNGVLVNQFGNLFQRIVALAIPVEAELNAVLAVTPVTVSGGIGEYFAEIQARLVEANRALQANRPWEVVGAARVERLSAQVVQLLQLLVLLEPVIPGKIRELTDILGWDGRALRIVREKRRAFTPV
jgi:methionyl-tRNA synthetase